MRRVVLGSLAPLGLLVAVAAAAGPGPSAARAADTGTWCASPSSTPDTVAGCVTAPGGPFLRDRYGRALVLHGVNAVYKVAPYELDAGSSGPNAFTDADAATMAGLGFDVVRLGIIWKGLEPGSLPPNDPQSCTEGLAGSASAAAEAPTTLASYLARLDTTVSLLAAHGIYALVDMHQDVYNEYFAGEGAPDWAVCTDGLPAVKTGNWSANYFTPPVGVAFEHLWNNDVTGGLQQNFDWVWSQVAAHFATDPSVIGYDVFNEPFSSELATGAGNALFDARLECFYTGTAHPGTVSGAGTPLVCPPTDPAQGAVAAIEQADPDHLVFYEPDVANDFGAVNWIGAMPFGRLVLGFHDYCLASAGQAYFDFYSSPVCSQPEALVFQQEARARAAASTPEQPGGPGWFMSEFGAGEDTTDLARVAGLADQNLVGWTYWQWKQYADPTGGSTEALVGSSGAVDPVKAAVLVRPYAQAVAGTPTSMAYDATSRVMTLQYESDPAITAPTIVFVPVDPAYDVYPTGYCTSVSGASVVSAPGADHLLLENAPAGGPVTVTVGPEPPGGC